MEHQLSKPNQDNHILLVGASGRVGQMVTKAWTVAQKYPPLVPQFRQSSGTVGLSWDPMLDDAPLLNATNDGPPFASMIVLAGVVPGRGQSLDLNTSIAEACLKAAHHAGIKRVLLASSSAVYGTNDGTPFHEQMHCQPANDYGAAKLAMEQATEVWRDRDINLCHLRIGNVAGADALLLNIAVDRLNAPVTIDVFPDGEGPLRSYIGPQTMVAVLHSLCSRNEPLPPALNIAAPVPVTMNALADAAGHQWKPRQVPAAPSQRITLDCSALSRLHDFSDADSTPEEMIRQWKDTRPS